MRDKNSLRDWTWGKRCIIGIRRNRHNLLFSRRDVSATSTLLISDISGDVTCDLSCGVTCTAWANERQADERFSTGKDDYMTLRCCVLSSVCNDLVEVCLYQRNKLHITMTNNNNNNNIHVHSTLPPHKVVTLSALNKTKKNIGIRLLV